MKMVPIDNFYYLKSSFQLADQFEKYLFTYGCEVYSDLIKILCIINQDKDESYFICKENKELIDSLREKYKCD